MGGPKGHALPGKNCNITEKTQMTRRGHFDVKSSLTSRMLGAHSITTL